MRGLVSFVILLIIIAIATPWLDGALAKKNYFEMVEAFNRETSYGINILDYQQGWFKSSAKITIERKPILPSPTLQTLTVDQIISHGPLVYDAGSGRWLFSLAAITSKIHFKPLMPDTFIEAHTLVSFQKTQSTTFSLPSLSALLPAANQLIIQGLNGKFKTSISGSNLDRIQSKGQLESIQLSNPFYSLVINNAGTQSDFTYKEFYKLWSGKNTLNLGIINLAVQGKPIVAINNAALQTRFGITNMMYSAGFILAVDQLNLPQEIGIAKSTLNISINNIDATLLANLPERIRTLGWQEKSNVLVSLLKPETSITFGMDCNTSFGHLTINQGNIAWPTEAFPLTMTNITPTMVVTAELRIAIPLLNYLVTQSDSHRPPMLPVPAIQQQNISFQDQVTEWIKRGYLVQNNNDYVAKFIFAEGKLKINGNDYQPSAPTVVTSLAPTSSAENTIPAFGLPGTNTLLH